MPSSGSSGSGGVWGRVTASPAPAGPGKKRERRRAASLPEPTAGELDVLVSRLGSEAGWELEMARVLRQLQHPDLTREQVMALGAQLRALNLVARRNQDRETAARLATMEKAVRDLERRLGGQRGGVVRRDDSPAFSVKASSGTYPQ